ncbi:histidine kinase [Pseudoduganella sp. LjRoot289]|uniref:PAS domain-containing sensor histidine kinase n=1 Tax=Pseudoduganella sp. LjRoot289 TaxID=3342314 RepID=UPI003ED0BE0E
MSRAGSEVQHGSDTLRQWQALQLSKLELELQQSALTALQQSADEARASSSLYQQLFEQAPACCYALDMAGRIVCVNQAGAALLAQPAGELHGQPFERYLASDEQPRWRAFAAILQAGNGRAGMESRLFDGIPGAAAVRLEARLDVASGLCCLVVSPPGVTQAELLALRDAGRDAELAELIPADAAGGITRRLQEQVAEQVAAQVAEQVAVQVAEQVAGQVAAQLAAQVAERTAALEQANALLRRQLAERNDESQTTRAAADRLHLLIDRQASAVEDTRQELARTVHDQLGQNLLALRLDVCMLNERSRHSHTRLHQRTDAALQIVDATLRSVRTIINQLRPPVLDLGLQAAIDWQLSQFRKQSGMACTFDAPDDEVFEHIGGNASVMLFRQLQAALAAVQRDGGASAAVVSVRRYDGDVLLTVTDDGAGGSGSAGEWRRQRQALAMLGIAERLRAFGGAFEVEYGRAGQGCRISMRLPAGRS